VRFGRLGNAECGATLIVLGINAFHADAAAALVSDGKLVAAAEEERFRRIKHWAGFPAQAIAYCLREGGLRLGDVDHVAINQDDRAERWLKLRYLMAHPPHPGLMLDRVTNRGKRKRVPDLLAAAFPGETLRASFHPVEHHLAHLSSAFHVSPFKEAAIVSVDGFGDFTSAAWGVGRGDVIAVTGRIHFPHSLGIFYQALTQYLGFPHYGDEYKVMGLAPYGSPSRLDAMREIVKLTSAGKFELDLRYFRHHRERVAFSWDAGTPEFGDLFSSTLEQLLGPRRRPDEPLEDRHRDIASSVQAMYEQAFFGLLDVQQAGLGLTDLTLAGGCAMNSVANGKVRRMTPFRRVYVQAAAGDAGGAIGAAYAVWHELGGYRRFVMDHAYWGPGYDREEISVLLAAERQNLERGGCRLDEIADDAELCRRTAAAIEDGRIVGWFQGRMEWGPRALGNRSILCDPRRGDIRAILNAKIKRRESFRPFAPSIIEEAVSEWFEEEDAVPFMMQVFQVRQDKRGLIPAVTHVDGSARLQTVSRRTNPLFHQLIEAFTERTGVPMLLNTSFNENEPVVCRPQEALDCFLRTRMDLLVLGNVIISRTGDSLV
jgi:carbamoyltransferase